MSASVRFIRNRRLWQVDLHQLGARWSCTSADGLKFDEATARAFAKECNKRMAGGDDLRPHSQPTTPAAPKKRGGETFRAFADAWLVREQTIRKATTNEFYAGFLREHLYPALGDEPIATIDRQRCIEVISGLIGKKSQRSGRPISQGTREGAQSTLSAVLTAAVDRGLLNANPAFRMGKYVKNPDEALKEIACFTAPEAARFVVLVKAHAEHWYPIILMALRTGLRIGELIELRWEKDFRHPNRVHVQRAYSPRKRRTLTVDGAGEHTYEPGDPGRVTKPKSGRARLVDLPLDVRTMLDDHRKAQRAAAFKSGKGQPSLVFTGHFGGRVDAGYLNKVIDNVLSHAAPSLPAITVHGLRHTYATVSLTANEPLAYVSAQLGHKDQSTTERHYKHWIPESNDPARLARLDSIWVVPKVEKG